MQTLVAFRREMAKRYIFSHGEEMRIQFAHVLMGLGFAGVGVAGGALRRRPPRPFRTVVDHGLRRPRRGAGAWLPPVVHVGHREDRGQASLRDRVRPVETPAPTKLTLVEESCSRN